MLFYLFRSSIPLQVIDMLFTKIRFTLKNAENIFITICFKILLSLD